MDEGNQVFPQSDSAALLVIEFPSFRDFIDAYSPIISEAGIFIRNADVSESNAFSVGDRVDFEVRLKDDFRLIQGSGDVVWLGPSEAAEGAAGTAIRFHDVDEPSQRLISRLVGNYVRDGGKLFEIGGSAVAAAVAEADPDFAPEQEPEQRSEALAALVEPGTDAELTAENLEAGEADELFAGDSEEPAAPLEFESVSLEEVEGRRPGAESPSLGLDGPVGLDTIAIPSDLLASLASEGKAEALKSALDFESGPEEAIAEPAAESVAELADEPVAAAVEDALESEELPFDPEEAMPPDEFPSAEDHFIDGESSLLSASETLGSGEPLLGEKADQGSLEAAAVSIDGQLGAGGVIPDDIAQVAEELSGVHRFELPEPDEISSVDYAGSASVGAERNTGGRIAALVVTFVLLGAGAYSFRDTILDTLGWGSDESAPAVPVVRSGEAQPSSPLPVENDTVDPDAGGEVAEAEKPAETPSFEPVQVTVERDSAEPVTSATAPDPSPRDGSGSLADAGPAAGPAAEPAPAPAASATSRRVERVTWREEGSETIVTIRLNAPISKALVNVVRVRDGAPREVIKIQGVEVPYSPRDMAVGSRHVVRLRTGLHRSQSGSALHVVADLTGAGVTVLSVESKGRDVLITFS